MAVFELIAYDLLKVEGECSSSAVQMGWNSDAKRPLISYPRFFDEVDDNGGYSMMKLSTGK